MSPVKPTRSVRRYATTPHLIADALRAEILSGQLRGRQVLPQEELAQRFGVSRIPVREALRNLESEGLVTIEPNRGAFVTDPSVDEVREAYELRALLEPAALRRAVPRFAARDHQRAERILHELATETSRVRWHQLDHEFHSALYAPADRPKLLELIESMRGVVNRYFDLNVDVLQYAERSRRDHQAILEACSRQDVDQAVALLGDHLEFAAKLLVPGGDSALPVKQVSNVPTRSLNTG
jgi:DNA-binding GntR family transcriptional regulator